MWLRSMASAVMLIALVPLPQSQTRPPSLPQVTERVNVDRVVIDVHVLADDGQPVQGLQIPDFKVIVDGRPVSIEQVRWTTESIATREMRTAAGAGTPSEAARMGLPAGRQIVLFVQRDLEASRFQGLVTMLRRARAFVDGLLPDDRVAVVTMQSHLELWSDYSTDRQALRRLIDRGVIVESPPADIKPSDAPSILQHFDRAAGRRAASVEQALLVLARALDQMPGEKSVVVFGFGFGRMLAGAGGTSVDFDHEYDEARRLLTRARATVFCLDVTDAASHTLEAGLMQVAADTGGFYVRTNEFPGLAMERLGRAISGRYEISIVRPDLPRGEHAIRVELVGRKATVLARGTYRD